jgi:2-haloacid dehalogenase
MLGGIAAAGLTAYAGLRNGIRASASPRNEPLRAVAFDAFTVFDRRPVDTAAEELFYGKGSILMSVWSAKQFEYTWLRTITASYTDFWQVTQDALDFAADQVGISLTGDTRSTLMSRWLDLRAWPDALDALPTLKARGLRLALLANPTSAMLDAWVANSNLGGIFEDHLTTDLVGAFKPDARAYQMAITAFGMPKSQIAFSAFGGWDAAGARAFGYTTFWVNRSGAPVDRLPATPDGAGPDLRALLGYIESVS